MPQKTKRRPSISRKLKIITLVCLVFAAALVIAAVVMQQRAVVDANAAAARDFNSKITPPAGTPGAVTPAITLSPAGGPISVHFSGDSLSDGWYASEEANGFRPIVQRSLEGQAEMEFVGTHQAGDRVQDIAEGFDIPEDMDLSIVELGTNDVTKETDPDLFREQYSAYLGELTTASPDGQLMCLGVFAFPNDAARIIDSHISAECASRGGTYIELKELFRDESLRGPMGAPTWLGPADEGHPNDAGHARIAGMVLSQIEIAD